MQKPNYASLLNIPSIRWWKYLSVKFILLFFFFLFCTNLLNAQSKDISRLDWFSLGIGKGTEKNASLFAGYTFSGENVYQLNFNVDYEISFIGASSDFFYTGSFSYGTAYHSKWFFGGIFIGPSIVYQNFMIDEDNFGTGINIDTQHFFAVSDVLGFGIDLYSNINTIKSTYGIRFSFFVKSVK